jgi:ketosteroid isomerase-like protein
MTVPNDELDHLRRLIAFAQAWNEHDLDGLMRCMTHDCVFEASSGPDQCGTRYEGAAAVRKAYAEIFATFPNAAWSNSRHWVSLDRGISEWTFSGARTDGVQVHVDGCDLFVLRNGLIAVKNSFRKHRMG